MSEQSLIKAKPTRVGNVKIVTRRANTILLSSSEKQCNKRSEEHPIQETYIKTSWRYKFFFFRYIKISSEQSLIKTKSTWIGNVKSLPIARAHKHFYPRVRTLDATNDKQRKRHPRISNNSISFRSRVSRYEFYDRCTLKESIGSRGLVDFPGFRNPTTQPVCMTQSTRCRMCSGACLTASTDVCTRVCIHVFPPASAPASTEVCPE